MAAYLSSTSVTYSLEDCCDYVRATFLLNMAVKLAIMLNIEHRCHPKGSRLALAPGPLSDVSHSKKTLEVDVLVDGFLVLRGQLFHCRNCCCYSFLVLNRHCCCWSHYADR